MNFTQEPTIVIKLSVEEAKHIVQQLNQNIKYTDVKNLVELKTLWLELELLTGSTDETNST